MIRGTRLLRRVLLAGTFAVVTPLAAGCEVGSSAPMLHYHQLGNGAYVTADGMRIIDAFVLSGPGGSSVPAGGSASLFLAVTNTTSTNDALQSVTAPGSASSVQVVGGPISIPAQQTAYLTGPQPRVILRHLIRSLRPGQTITVDFTFQRAGTVPATVPVLPRISYYATFSPPAPSPSTTPRNRRRTTAGRAGATAATSTRSAPRSAGATRTSAP